MPKYYLFPGSAHSRGGSGAAGTSHENVTSAGWQVTLRDPVWHVSSRSGVATVANCYTPFTLPCLYPPNM